MPCEQCVNRRDFLGKSALVAAALVAVDGCGDGQIGAPIRNVAPGQDPNVPVSPSVIISLSSFPELATLGQLVDVGNERAVVRTSDTTFRALSRICTHEQCDTDVRNNRFECPCHGSIFAADGSVIRGPNVSGSVSALRTLSVLYNQAAGTLTIA
jgi:Rieske Fe-S protein